MKLASITYQGIDRIVAAVDERRVVDIADAFAAVFDDRVSAPGDMLELLQGGEEVLSQISEAVDAVRKSSDTVEMIFQSDVYWHAPIRNPGKVCGLAMNNSASNKRKIIAPEHPAFFLKPASCLIGHKEPIVIRKYYGSVHPEPELAVIIGKQMRDVPAVDAMDYVAGFTVMNDLTGNDMRAEDLFQYWAIYGKEDNPNETRRVQQNLSYAGRYKGCDTFGVLGPWLVTQEEISTPDDLAVECRVGDEIIAEDSTRYYNYKVSEILSFINQFHTLHPGDVVSCGTAFKPAKNRKSIHNANFQKVPGPVSVSIEGLGVQQNPVIVEDREIGEWRLN